MSAVMPAYLAPYLPLAPRAVEQRTRDILACTLAYPHGRRIAVGPDGTLAEALHHEGLAVGMVCDQGICGSCVTRYLDGELIHCDACLTPDEQATHEAVCCARSDSPTLILDI
jgi:vanillate O-demethylase ferredoxin subunit